MIANLDGRLKLNAVKLFRLLLVLRSTVMRAENPAGDCGLKVSVDEADGRYNIGMPEAKIAVLHAGIGVKVNGRWLFTRDYSRPTVRRSTATDLFGSAADWEVVYLAAMRCRSFAITCEPMQEDRTAIYRSQFETRRESRSL